MSPVLERGARSHFDLKEGAGSALVPGKNESGDAWRLQLDGKKTREENQIKDDPKRIAAGAVRPQPKMGSYAL
jgi:hypothetical protein